MPITIKTANMKYKNSEGEYVGVNAISDNTTAEQLARIEDKGDEVIASIPSDYTALQTQVDNIEGMIASEFSTSTAYAIGDLVIYNDHYYRFKTAHPAGAWNASHVDQTTVSGEIISNVTDLKNSLHNNTMRTFVNEDAYINIMDYGDFIKGKYYNLNGNLISNSNIVGSTKAIELPLYTKVIEYYFPKKEVGDSAITYWNQNGELVDSKILNITSGNYPKTTLDFVPDNAKYVRLPFYDFDVKVFVSSYLITGVVNGCSGDDIISKMQHYSRSIISGSLYTTKAVLCSGQFIANERFSVIAKNGYLVNYTHYTSGGSATTGEWVRSFELIEGETYQIYFKKSDDSQIYLKELRNLYIEGSNKSLFSGKKISIYGDSISTYSGWIPQGNATYYNGTNAGVTNVEQTWWKKVIDALDMELVVNNSWSGRAVSSIRDSQSWGATFAGYKEANVLQLKDGTTLPDVIIIKMGINDFDDGAILGDYDGSTALPTDPTKFLDAYAIMLNLIMTNFPLAEVYCCTLMQSERIGGTGFPEINSQGNSIEEWNAGIIKLAHAFGAKILNHDICGITYYNLSTYMGDYSSSTGQGLHPNASGMSLIANQTINEMDNAIRIRY